MLRNERPEIARKPESGPLDVSTPPAYRRPLCRAIVHQSGRPLSSTDAKLLLRKYNEPGMKV